MTTLTDLPATSSPMPWHSSLWEQLIAQADSDQLPHALLLSGPRYVGKARLALALARRLLCSGEKGSLNCGECHACQLSASGGHGDFRWVEPEEKSRAIKVDQVREVVQFATRTAGFGERKVVVLAPADAMNLNACNALLKSLEEPAGDTYWILVCHRMYTLPATIRSRCQLLRPGSPDEEASRDWLAGITGDRDQAQAMLALADGRPLLAQDYFQQGTGTEAAARQKALRALLAGQIGVPEASSLWVDEEPDDFLRVIAEELQQVSRVIPLDKLRTPEGRSVFLLQEEILRLQRAVGGGSNPNKQLLVESTLLKIRRELGTALLGDTM